jgi:hypothetical protein
MDQGDMVMGKKTNVRRLMTLGGAGALAAVAVAPKSHATLLVADGFDYPTGALTGNADSDFTSNPATWSITGGAASDGNVVAGNLVFTGANALASLPGTNSVQINNTKGGADRIQLTSPATAFNFTNDPNTSLYYSFTMQVSDISKLGTTSGGAFIAGFNNSVGTTGTALTTAGGVLTIRTDSTNSGSFHLGTAQNQGNTRNYNNGVSFGVNDVLFVVGKYSFGTADGQDTSALYVFDGTTGDAISLTEPGTALATSAFEADLPGGDNIESFFLRNNVGAVGATIDDVRVGTTWADVTSTPEPGSLTLIGLGGAVALTRRRRQKRTD